MAALQSTLENSKGNTVSSTQHQVARVMAATWDVAITTVLTKDGTYNITVKDRKTNKILRSIDGCYNAQDRLQEAS